MRKIKYLLLFLIVLLIIPFGVFAEDENDTTEEVTESETSESTDKSTPVNVYFFRGEGCSHCAEAEAWFDSIKDEHGSKFKIIDYETWYNEDNAKLMEKVAKARGEEANGVPYIIVGNKSWNGFTEDYGKEILSEIDSLYAKKKSDRYDIMNYVSDGKKKNKKDSSGSDIGALLVILLVFGGIGFGIYKARESV